MDYDYRDFRIGDLISYEVNTPMGKHFEQGEGKVFSVDMNHATGITFLGIEVTKVIYNNTDKVGDTQTILHRNVTGVLSSKVKFWRRANYNNYTERIKVSSYTCDKCKRGWKR